MTDEEKEAIEILIGIREFANLSNYKDTKIRQLNAIDAVLNLIEKQSKEIEELKANKGYHLGFIDGGIAKRYEYEDKIKAKIEDILNSENSEAIEKLIEWQSLLEKE